MIKVFPRKMKQEKHGVLRREKEDGGGGDVGDDDENHDDDALVEEVLDRMTWRDQVGQMGQIDVNMLLTDDKTQLRQDLVDHYVGVLGVGSVLNNIVSPDTYWSVSDFRKAVIQIQQTAKKYKRPPVIWGLDSVHGANYLINTITTPQPINLAASFNDTLSYQAGRWASIDTRRAGINWLFSPLLGLSWKPHWSRVYETFGEDPVVVGNMAKAMIEGIQQVDYVNNNKYNSNKTQIPSRAAACGKHWLGYSMPIDGHDRAPSWIPTRHLYQYFLLPWKEVISQVDTVMESYTEVDGVPNVANRQTLMRLLRHELDFKGMLVTDYHEIFNLAEWHHTAKDNTAALKKALEEGSVDMSMIANEPDDFFSSMEVLVQNHTHCQQRVKQSARRVLKLKQKLNMFEESFHMDVPDDLDDPPTKKDFQAALEMTHQSIILAKNKDDALPLTSTEPLKVLVTGPTSHSLSYQTGGWTGQWQGVEPDKEDEWFTYGSTVRSAIEFGAGTEWDVSFECGVNILGADCDPSEDGLDAMQVEQQQQQQDQHQGVVGTVKGWVGLGDDDDTTSYRSIERAMNVATNKDTIIVCIGEENYTEKPGDIRSLSLPSGQYELVAALRQAAPPTAKIIMIYFGGRPRLLRQVEEYADAIFLGFLAGPMSGDAILDMITGNVNPSAKLPITYPKYEDGGGIPYLHAVSDMCTKDVDDEPLPHWENGPCDVQWPFGHGLSYTTFEYEHPTVSTTSLTFDRNTKIAAEEDLPTLEVTVTVKNTGPMAGSETVMFFTFDESRSTTPEYKKLRGYKKIWLDAGSWTKVSLSIPINDFRFIGPHDDTHYIFEDGLTFRVGVGGPDTDCRVEPTNVLCSIPVTIHTTEEYVGACEVSCDDLWSKSGCMKHYDMTIDKCWEMCTSIHQNVNNNNNDLQMNNDGWGWNYVDCMESILQTSNNNDENDDLNNVFDPKKDCWKLTTFCRDVFVTPDMDEYGHGITPNQFSTESSAYNSFTLLLAIIAGFVSSILICHVMRGGCSKKENDTYGDVQFAPIRSQLSIT